MAASERFHSLDGWRGISILCVLASHLIPLGPREWQFNVSAGLLGMVLFFTLSGFLVTNLLLHHQGTVDFLLRRFFRIIPLAWTFMAVALLFQLAAPGTWLAHFLFYANFPPEKLTPVTAHLWSLCVEMHFYLGIALLYLVFKRRGLYVLPLLCIAFTVNRVIDGVHYSSATWYRIDEILAGATLALVYAHPGCIRVRQLLQRIHPLWVLSLLLVACHPEGGAMSYLRPYFSALLVGTTLFGHRATLTRLLDGRLLAYIASISYALYVFHPALSHSWLGTGDLLEKYAKRPLLFAALFLLAHLSTRRFEEPCIAFGKRLAARWSARGTAPRAVLEKEQA